MTSDGKSIHAHVSDEAHDAIHQLAAAEGCSATALIEALGLQIAAGSNDITSLAIDARRITGARRRRNR